MRIQIALTALLLISTASFPAGAQGPGGPPGPPGPPQIPADLTVLVDCGAGESLAAALAQRADRLTIEFRGSCAENLVIQRDDVTLRGGAPGAEITGATGSPPQPNLLLDGASRVALADFAVRGSDTAGIRLIGAAAAQLEGVTVEGNAGPGLIAVDGSFARLIDSAFNGNGGDGIGAWGNSSLEIGGSLEASDNGRVGLILSTGSGLQVTSAGLTMVADRNAFGVATQLAASAQLSSGGGVTLAFRDNTSWGVTAIFGAQLGFGGPMEISGSTVGLLVTQASELAADGLTVTGNSFGVFGDEGSMLDLNAAEVSGNDFGILYENATMFLSNSTVRDNTILDLLLDFGARATFGNGNDIGSFACGEAVLVRGPLSCPSPLAEAPGPSVAPPRPPRTPFEQE